MIREDAIDYAQQVAFLLNVQRLLGEGSFVATYKFALLHALADLALSEGDDSGAELLLETRKIAERLIELYWPQTEEHPLGAHQHQVIVPDLGIVARRQLLQNTKGQAAIIRYITEGARGRSLHQLRHDPRYWGPLVGKVDAKLQVMPLWKLQTVGGDALEFLYPNEPSPATPRIRLLPGVAYCLRAFHGLVTELCRGAWLRFIRRQNSELERNVGDLSRFLFGRERDDLSVHRLPLFHDQSGDCFYCRQPMGADEGHVDHFVPWSRYAADLPHNFVLAHAKCNLNKSDFLAAEAHLERWMQRNAASTDIFVGTGWTGVGLPTPARAHNVARWAYAQTEASKLRVWAEGRRVEPLSGRWRTLFS